MYTFNLNNLYTMLLDNFDPVPALLVNTSEEMNVPFLWGVIENTDYEFIMIKPTPYVDLEVILTKAIQYRKSSDWVKREYPPFPNLTITSRLKTIYSRTIEICNVLDIPCPQVYMCPADRMGNSDGLQFFSDCGDGTKIGFVELKAQGLAAQTATLAHELRHCWQHKNGLRNKRKYVSPEENELEYFFQPTEIDAEAFSLLYMEKVYGVDGVQLALSQGNEIYRMKDYVSTVKERMREIEVELSDKLSTAK